MACMANEPQASSSSSSSNNNATPSTSQQQQPSSSQHKRCSLPGPMGSLNLYATHQQRRLSERGLMIYRPSKPDIDLIGDFINPNKKSIPNTTNAPAGSLSSSPPTGVTGAGAGSGSNNISDTAGLSGLPTITSPSSSSSSKKSGRSCSISNPGNTSTGNYATHSASGVGGFIFSSTSSSSSTPGRGSSSGGGGGGCRKVRLRIQKNPGGKENKFVEIQNVSQPSDSSTPTTDLPSSASSSSSNSSPDNGNLLLQHPLLDSRRHSDSVAYGKNKLPQINIHPSEGTGIVCSTGDLRALKCLTSSAQEIQYKYYGYGSRSSTPTPENLGNRSRSFDATYNNSTSQKRGIGSSWFSRRHLPISGKLPISLNSPSVPSSPGPNQLSHKAPPILTVTNESSGQSEIIEVPSPPACTPSSSGDSPEHKTKVPWDTTGFLLDAAVLGSVIENHLIKKTDMKRRATVSTLYEPEQTNPYQGTTRARSASASIIPIPGSLVDNNSSSGGGSIFSSNSTGGRRTSLSIRTNSNSESLSSTSLRNHNREKRGSLSTGASFPVKSSLPQRERSQSLYVETMDPNGKGVVTSKIMTPLPPGQIFTEDELLEESRRRTEYYRKVSLQHQAEENNETNQQQSSNTGSSSGAGGHGHHGLSICTAIRDFIMHSLRS